MKTWERQSYVAKMSVALQQRVAACLAEGGLVRHTHPRVQRAIDCGSPIPVEVVESPVTHVEDGLVDDILLRTAQESALSRVARTGRIQDSKLELLDALWHCIDDVLLQGICRRDPWVHFVERSPGERRRSVEASLPFHGPYSSRRAFGSELETVRLESPRPRELSHCSILIIAYARKLSIFMNFGGSRRSLVTLNAEVEQFRCRPAPIWYIFGFRAGSHAK
jgi:hypothetical protein